MHHHQKKAHAHSKAWGEEAKTTYNDEFTCLADDKKLDNSDANTLEKMNAFINGKCHPVIFVPGFVNFFFSLFFNKNIYI